MPESGWISAALGGLSGEPWCEISLEEFRVLGAKNVLGIASPTLDLEGLEARIQREHGSGNFVFLRRPRAAWLDPLAGGEPSDASSLGLFQKLRARGFSAREVDLLSNSSSNPTSNTSSSSRETQPGAASEALLLDARAFSGSPSAAGWILEGIGGGVGLEGQLDRRLAAFTLAEAGSLALACPEAILLVAPGGQEFDFLDSVTAVRKWDPSRLDWIRIQGSSVDFGTASKAASFAFSRSEDGQAWPLGNPLDIEILRQLSGGWNDLPEVFGGLLSEDSEAGTQRDFRQIFFNGRELSFLPESLLGSEALPAQPKNTWLADQIFRLGELHPGILSVWGKSQGFSTWRELYQELFLLVGLSESALEALPDSLLGKLAPIPDWGIPPFREPPREVASGPLSREWEMRQGFFQGRLFYGAHRLHRSLKSWLPLPPKRAPSRESEP